MIEKITMLSDWLWSYPMVILLALGSIYVTIRFKFVQIVKLPLIIKTVYKDIVKENSGEGDISALQAALTAIGSTLGAGNIMGVAVAVSMGGVGALFWMIVIGLFAVCLKYAEVILGIKYREKMNLENMLAGRCII